MLKKTTLLVALLITAGQLSWAQTKSTNAVSLENATATRYTLRSTDNFIAMTVKNNGATPINTLKASWSDGNITNSATIRTSIAAGETKVIEHPKPINYSAIVEKNITVSLDLVNAEKDAFTADNSQTINFNTVSRKGTKAIVIEEGTGTWCKWCPGGTAAIDYMYKKKLETFIAIAIHTGDPMEFEEYIEKTKLRGLPGYNADRVLMDQGFDSEECLQVPHDKRKGLEVPADLDISAQASGNKISVTAKANFYTKFSNADFRLGVIVTEDNVTGTGRGYAQANGFSGGSDKAGGFENKPNPVPAKDMVYNHVARALLGGYNGQPNSVPSTIKEGDVAKHTFEYTVPSELKKDNLKFIVVLIKESNGELVNAKEFSIKDALSIKKQSIADLKVYPNPAKTNLTIDFNATDNNYDVAIYDISGRLVLDKTYSNIAGKQSLNIPVSKLSKGSYVATISSDKAFHSQIILIE